MLHRLNSLDIFATQFSLNSTKGSRTYNTAGGGLLTIIAVILFSIITYIVSSDYLDTTKPVVSVNKIKMKKPERIDLFKNEVISAFSIFAGRFFTKDQTRKFMTTRVEIVTTEEDADGKRVETVQPYETDVVDNLKHPDLSKLGIRGLKEASQQIDLYENFGGNFIFPDIDSEDFWIAGSTFNLPYRRLRIKVFPCSLPDPSQCASQKELAGALFGNQVLSKAVNFSDKANPKRFFSDADTVIQFGLSSTIIVNTYYKKNLIYDDDLGMVGKRLSHSFVDVDKFGSILKTRLSPVTHCTEAQIDGGACQPYMEVNWKASFEKTVIQRRYITPFDVVSEIGGFWDLINYAILAVYFYYNTRSYTRFIRSQLVGGYLEMDRMRLGEGVRRTPDQIKRMKSSLMDKRLLKHNPDSKRISFRHILETDVDILKLIELNNKSKLLVEALSNGLNFSPLTAELIFRKKIEGVRGTKKSNRGEKGSSKLTKKLGLFEKANLAQGNSSKAAENASKQIIPEELNFVFGIQDDRVPKSQRGLNLEGITSQGGSPPSRNGERGVSGVVDPGSGQGFADNAYSRKKLQREENGPKRAQKNQQKIEKHKENEKIAQKKFVTHPKQPKKRLKRPLGSKSSIGSRRFTPMNMRRGLFRGRKK